MTHADLHLGNLLLYSPKIANWSTIEDIEKNLGKPERYPFRLDDASGSLPPASPHVPSYCVPAPSYDSTTSLLHLCLDDPEQAHIKICDFSESFLFHPTTPTKRRSNSPKIFRDPQTMFDTTDLVCPTPATDVWALAVLFHMLFTGGCGLFPCGSFGKDDDTLREMIFLLGKLPEPYWSRWSNRARYFDDDANWVGEKRHLRKISGQFLKLWDEDVMDTEERRLFEDMLRSMVVYDPERRINADDVVNSSWFVKYTPTKS
jgi:serine/threonine-protein kinase SRPK3